MIDIIKNRKFFGRTIEGRAGRFSEKGLNNLLRAKIGGNCVGNSNGTWDYIKGEFC